MHKTALARRQRGVTGQALRTTQKTCSRRLSCGAASRYNPKLSFCRRVASNVYWLQLKLLIAAFLHAHEAYLVPNTLKSAYGKRQLMFLTSHSH